MLDDDGKEVPGTKGYKCVLRTAFIIPHVQFRVSCAELLRNRYFGRAKELPGVKELFQSRAKDEDEENQAQAFYKKFTNQGPPYYGDLDERDGSLLEYERKQEEAGASD